MRFNVQLRDMNVSVPVDGDRAIEVLASGLPVWHGAQLAIDITLRSATSANGLPRRNAAHRDGAVLTQARADREAKYVELVAGNRCFLVVIALETGGRWSGETVEFIDMLAGAHAREVLPLMRRSVHLAWRRWWMRMLVVSCARAFATSLVAPVRGVALTARRQIWLICWVRPEF